MKYFLIQIFLLFATVPIQVAVAQTTNQQSLIEGILFENSRTAVSPAGGGVAIAPSATPVSSDPNIWIDPKTGLMWVKQISRNDVAIRDAYQSAANSRVGGFSDWRLPTAEEFVASSNRLKEVGGYNNKCAVFDPPHPLATALTGRYFVLFRVNSGRLSSSGKVISGLMVGVCGAESIHDKQVSVQHTSDLLLALQQAENRIGKFGVFSIPNESFDANNESLGKSLVRSSAFVLVRGTPPPDYQIAMQAFFAEADSLKRSREEATRRDELQLRAQQERESREYEAKRAKDEANFNSLLRSPSPRTMFLSAVNLEDSGDRGKAKTVYRELMKRFPNAQETLLASQRLTRLGDVEAVESSNSNAAANARSAADSVRTQNYEQCLNERNACYQRCGQLRGVAESRCTSGCAICSR